MHHQWRRRFCTTSIALRYNSSSSASKKNDRVSISLYRQLLSWCRRYDDIPYFSEPLRIDVPSSTTTTTSTTRLSLVSALAPSNPHLAEQRAFLSNNIRSLLPPEHLVMSASIDVLDTTSWSSDNDDELYEYRLSKWRHPAQYVMYDKRVTLGVSEEDDGSIIKTTTFPEITNAKELRATIRSIYWLNSCAELNDEVTNKRRIGLAFDTIKTCNQLSSTELNVRHVKRYSSLEVRQGVDIVTYYIGQIVTHTVDKWKGVIVGWTPNTKNGSIPHYVVLVDTNDASVLQKSELLAFVPQTDLSPISGGGEGIYNTLTKEYFTMFVPPTEEGGGQYVPNKMLDYMYPLDRRMGTLENDDKKKKKKKCEEQQSHQEVTEEYDDNSNPLSKGINSVSWLPSVHDRFHILNVDSIGADDGVIETLPLFPLGNMVYLPSSTHILSIFEPRYRKMYNDIMSIGSKRFVVSTCHPTEDGKFAQWGVLFEITDMEDISQVVGDRVKYICNHRVIGRVKIHRLLNPKVWVTKETYLEVEGTIIYDDVADYNSNVMSTKNNDDPTELLLKSNAEENNALEEKLAQCYRDIVTMQHDLKEGVLLNANETITGFTEGDEFWKFVNVWQSYIQLSQKMEQDNYYTGYNETMIGFSRKENNETTENLSPELQLELKDLQRNIAAASKRSWLDWTLSMQKILEAKHHNERLKLMIYFIEVERKRLVMKTSSRDILLGLSNIRGD
jgi:Lon protease-like protein